MNNAWDKKWQEELLKLRQDGKSEYPPSKSNVKFTFATESPSFTKSSENSGFSFDKPTENSSESSHGGFTFGMHPVENPNWPKGGGINLGK
jgi:hypothetical protein